MEETVRGNETISPTQKNMQAYLQSHDIQYVAEDAVYKNLSTGEEHSGKAEVGAMLHYMYHVAFDAKADVKNYIITEDKAMFEGFFKGRHIGEFADIPPTNKEVNVPLCVTYDLKNSLIQEARIYFITDVLMQQLQASPNASPQRTTYVTRDIFYLKFGHYKEARALLDEAQNRSMLPHAQNVRVLTDFTGEAYRLIMEEGYNSLADYENSLTSELGQAEWKDWYERFKPHVMSSYREILKQVM